MNTLIKYAAGFWFEPAPASRLAILRIATGLFSLWYLIDRYKLLLSLPANDASMYEPVGIMQLFPEPMPTFFFTFLLVATIGLNILYILGWKFKFTGIAFAIFLLVLFCYRNSWSMIYHNYNLLVLHIFIIGIAASGDSLSVSTLNTMSPKMQHLESWKYGWPIKLICLVTAIAYFVSGMAKLSGDLAWNWMSGEAMRSQIAVDSLRKMAMGENVLPLFERLYAHEWMFSGMAMMTIVVELGAPFFLFTKRFIYIWILLALAMHWGIFFLMGIRFYHHMTGLVFLPFLSPEKWIDLIKQNLKFGKKPVSAIDPAKEPALVLFDGECNFCNSTVRFIINNDPNGYFHFASQQSATGNRMLKQFHLPANLSTIVLIDENRSYAKSTAILNICKQLKAPWKYLYLFIILPAFIRDWFYNIISKNRYCLFGKKNSCEIPPPQIRDRFSN